MKKLVVAFFLGAGLVSVTCAQTTIINTDFSNSDSPGYSDGDIVGQNNWLVSPNTGTNAFNIIGASSNGWADTVSAAGNFNTNGGSFVYLSSPTVGNAVDTEWNGSMDFTVSSSTNAYGAGDIFKIGSSSAIGSTTGLVSTFTSDVYLSVSRASNGRLRIKTFDASGDFILIETPDETLPGWDADNGGSKTTDPLRLQWNVRQTRDSNIYGLTATLENLNPSNLSSMASSTVYIEKADAYAAGSSSFVMGLPGAAFSANTGAKLDITIDTLSFVETNGVLPVLDKPVVSVTDSNATVDLAWGYVVEAQTYDVTQIHGAVTSLVASAIATNGYRDTGLVNGDEYYYIVTAKGLGAANVNSDPVLGTPDVALFNQTFLDTTFAATDSPAYADGDLAGQNRWKSIAVTDPNAFNVDTNVSGYAKTDASNGSFTGAQVYYNKITENGEGHVWSGTMDFSLKAAPAAGLYATNTYTDVVTTNAVTNIQQVANLTGNEAFTFGLTSDTDTELQPKGNDDVLIGVRYTGQGDITFGLNQYNATANLMLTIPRSDTGWDPQWQDQPASNGPVFETDPISVDWTIRKTTVTNTYNAQVVATIGTNTFTSIIEYTDASDTKNRPEAAFAASVVRFAMGQKVKSVDEQVYVSVDAVSVTHTNASDIPLGAPSGLSGTLGNLAINLTWGIGGEEDSFDIYRSEVEGGPYSNIASSVTGSYTDSGLTDLRTYFYVVKAVYPGALESDFSGQLIIRALGINNPLSWGLSPSINTAGSDQKTTGWATDASGAYQYVYGTGINGSFISTADLTWYNTSAAPLLYGIVQQAADGGTEYYTIRNGTSSDLLRIKTDDGSSNTPGSKMFWVQGTSVDAANQTISLEVGPASWNGTARVIIRNGSTWYASESTLPANGTFSVPDLKGENWAEFSPAKATDGNLVAVTNSFLPGVGLALSDVNALGFLSVGDNHVARNFNYWKINVGTQPSGYDLWTDNYGIYNDDAVTTNDYDLDGANNVWEWGLGGDPTDASDVGITDRFGGVDGTNFVYIYPRLKDSARPNYFLTETDNLVFTDFTNHEGDYTMTAGGDWPGEADFEAVTNEIPTTTSVKFIQLNVE